MDPKLIACFTFISHCGATDRSCTNSQIHFRKIKNDWFAKTFFKCLPDNSVGFKIVIMLCQNECLCRYFFSDKVLSRIEYLSYL